MTIATCYLSPEGVVLGADSTTTYISDNGPHYYNHAQKIFEIGDNGRLGIVTWGLGNLNDESYRRLFAKFSDELDQSGYDSVINATERWIDLFWNAYDASDLLQLYRNLAAKQTRSPDEENVFISLQQNLVVGFCLGGHALPERKPEAAFMIFDPTQGKPTPIALTYGSMRFWGAPNMISRLLNGYDPQLIDSIMASGRWNGTAADLLATLEPNRLCSNLLPLRDAVDIVHACILGTIKALKFSNLAQICGGPIEIAVISADRTFRWVRHKSWDSAIEEGRL